MAGQIVMSEGALKQLIDQIASQMQWDLDYAEVVPIDVMPLHYPVLGGRVSDKKLRFEYNIDTGNIYYIPDNSIILTEEDAKAAEEHKRSVQQLILRVFCSKDMMGHIASFLTHKAGKPVERSVRVGFDANRGEVIMGRVKDYSNQDGAYKLLLLNQSINDAILFGLSKEQRAVFRFPTSQFLQPHGWQIDGYGGYHHTRKEFTLYHEGVVQRVLGFEPIPQKPLLQGPVKNPLAELPFMGWRLTYHHKERAPYSDLLDDENGRKAYPPRILPGAKFEAWLTRSLGHKLQVHKHKLADLDIHVRCAECFEQTALKYSKRLVVFRGGHALEGEFIQPGFRKEHHLKRTEVKVTQQERLTNSFHIRGTLVHFWANQDEFIEAPPGHAHVKTMNMCNECEPYVDAVMSTKAQRDIESVMHYYAEPHNFAHYPHTAFWRRNGWLQPPDQQVFPNLVLHIPHNHAMQAIEEHFADIWV